MTIISAQNLSKTHGVKELFRSINLGIEETDRIALIGVNGSGKSTLLKVLAGIEQPDSGAVVLRQGVIVEFASQNPVFQPEHTILEHIFHAQTELAAAVIEYEKLCVKIAAAGDSADETLQNRLGAASARMDALNAWEYESRAKVILNKLGVEDLERRMSDLSGGYRKRVALARALLNESDLLILDEPTNHLDADTIAWLEDYLQRYTGAVLLVTHDRYFLDRVTNQIIELHEGAIRTFKGSFSYYLTTKAEIANEEARHDERRRSILKKELEWLGRGARARRTKEKHRIERIEDLKEAAPTRKPDPLKFVSGSRRLGSKIVELEKVSKAFGDRTVIRDFDYTFKPGERLGIIGPNGAGKSTLVNLITGKLSPDSGTVYVGDTVFFGLFDQESSDLNPEEKVINYIKREGGDALRAPDGTVLTAERMLERFLFTPQMLHQSISRLSGGERRRLHLVRLLLQDPNFLILDEPTNDLDIQTLQALEDYLDNFVGCLLVVSHDRYFLDRTTDHLVAVEKGGKLRLFPGAYSIYERIKAEEEAEALSAEKEKKQKTAKQEEKPKAAKDEGKKKLTFNEQRELASLEKDIPNWEERLESIQTEMAAAATDYVKLAELTKEQQDLNEKLENGFVRWEELASRV